MKHSIVIKSLKNLQRFKPDAEWLAQNRALLLHYLKNHPQAAWQEKPDVALHPRLLWHFGLRPLSIVALVLVILIGAGATTVVAALNVLPTHPLYPVKLTTEKLEGLLIFNDAKKINFIVSLAQKRLQELELTMVEQGDVEPEVVESILRRYSELIDEASEGINELAKSGSKVELISAVSNFEASPHRQILLTLEGTSASSSGALSEAQSASLKADEVVLNVLKEDEQSKKELIKKQTMANLDLLNQQINQLDEQFSEIKSIKGYLPLLEADQKFQQVRSLLEQGRRLLDRGEYAAAADSATDGLRLVIEVKKDLIRLFGSEPLE